MKAVTKVSDAPSYLDTAAAVERFVAQIGDTRMLAVDTEGASFHRYHDRIYLLQLSTPERHAIIDPLRAGNLDPLRTLVESPDVEVVFHDADYDLRLLHQDYGWQVGNIFDTRIAAQLLGIRAFGLAALLEQNFAVRLDKRFQRADWSMRPLSQDMLSYAAQDTMHLLALRERLRDELMRRGRWDWATEEFARLEGTRWDEEDPGGAFLRIKGARDLTRRELAVLRELVPWREEVARELDRSTFRVVANEVLLELSRRGPSSKAELAAIKGMPRGMVEARGAALIAAVQRGLKVAEGELPRFPKAPRWARDPDFDDRVNRLRQVRDAKARELDLEPGVLCARERLEAIARRKPDTLEDLAEVPELRRWQIDVLGEELLKAMMPPGARRGNGA
ncbi:MAG TPA: HRDC domain-containing protein [Gemmatimonadaceae bacterium]|nr:HRDC domain-containing protein [Gemmatimonadaceae bacterium]